VPLPVEKQVVTIFAGTQGYCDSLPVSSLRRFELELHKHIETKHNDILESIRTKKEIDNDLRKKLGDVIASFAKDFGAAQAAE
jgi:F-type H+-transporting ATPase subunit alpha